MKRVFDWHIAQMTETEKTLQVVRQLKAANPDMTQKELAAALGKSQTQVNRYLKRIGANNG